MKQTLKSIVCVLQISIVQKHTQKALLTHAQELSKYSSTFDTTQSNIEMLHVNAIIYF